MLGIDVIPRDAEHDIVCAVAKWVEKGDAPERLLGTHYTVTPEGLRFEYDLPSYAYPNVTEFVGGNAKNHDNYRQRYDEAAFV